MRYTFSVAGMLSTKEANKNIKVQIFADVGIHLAQLVETKASSFQCVSFSLFWELVHLLCHKITFMSKVFCDTLVIFYWGSTVSICLALVSMDWCQKCKKRFIHLYFQNYSFLSIPPLPSSRLGFPCIRCFPLWSFFFNISLSLSITHTHTVTLSLLACVGLFVCLFVVFFFYNFLSCLLTSHFWFETFGFTSLWRALDFKQILCQLACEIKHVSCFALFSHVMGIVYIALMGYMMIRWDVPHRLIV